MKLTQEQVAWSTGMSRVYISETERGFREPCLGSIMKLSRTLGVSASMMLAEVEAELNGTMPGG